MQCDKKYNSALYTQLFCGNYTRQLVLAAPQLKTVDVVGTVLLPVYLTDGNYIEGTISMPLKA